MPGYGFWSGLSIAVAAALTYASGRLWDRFIKREELDAQRRADAMEAVARRQKEAERLAVEEMAQSERRYRALAQAGASAVWRADANGRLTALQDWEALTGLPHELVLEGVHSWLDGLHPDDREAAAAAWMHSVRSGEQFQTVYRVRPRDSADWRWCRSRGVPVRGEPDAESPEGSIVEWVGVVHDIDSERRAENQRRLLAMEVNHRAKNTLAVVLTLVRMGGGTDAQANEKLLARIQSLARAHDLLAQRDWRDTDLRTVVETELGYFDYKMTKPTFRLAGPVVPVAAGAVQAITVVLHELATNAAKHGALADDGSVDMHWIVDGDALHLCWTEMTASGATTAPIIWGFGKRVIDSTIKGQLGGTIERRWPDSGLVCDIRLPLARLQSPSQKAAESASPLPPQLPLAAREQQASPDYSPGLAGMMQPPDRA
jgi:PAS domain S-box-containing protein